MTSGGKRAGSGNIEGSDIRGGQRLEKPVRRSAVVSCLLQHEAVKTESGSDHAPDDSGNAELAGHHPVGYDVAYIPAGAPAGVGPFALAELGQVMQEKIPFLRRGAGDVLCHGRCGLVGDSATIQRLPIPWHGVDPLVGSRHG